MLVLKLFQKISILGVLHDHIGVEYEVFEDYIEQFCPFCGEEHEEVEETITDIDENWD